MFDAERAGGFQDADIEMAGAYAVGAKIDALLARGECTHTSARTLPDGRELCTSGCGETFPSFAALVEAMNEALA